MSLWPKENEVMWPIQQAYTFRLVNYILLEKHKRNPRMQWFKSKNLLKSSFFFFFWLLNQTKRIILMSIVSNIVYQTHAWVHSYKQMIFCWEDEIQNQTEDRSLTKHPTHSKIDILCINHYEGVITMCDPKVLSPQSPVPTRIEYLEKKNILP